MEISKANILSKTHYGLKIYAYVLQQYYPNSTVLSLTGRDCGVTCNPFNHNKKTLHIYIENKIAKHNDTDLIGFKGNVFKFAQLHFKSQNTDDLVHTINKVLHLNLSNRKKTEIDWLNQPDDTWYALCSFFKAPVRNVFPLKTLKMHEIHALILSDKYKNQTQTLRNIQNPIEKRKFKANNFDYVTFSGIFERRNDNNLIKHSSLITIDFDHLNNCNDIKNQLLNDEYFDTELLFTSPSGNGLKWVIKIDLSLATHQEYFKAVANYLMYKYKLEVDQSGKDLSRACFLSYDPNAFLHKKHRVI